MGLKLEVVFTPAEFRALRDRDLSQTFCVVFDVLRATSCFVTALANGAAGVIPVSEIREALELRRKQPAVLLAGEREGVRIRAAESGDADFDLGNSPREFTREAVAGRLIVSTTTNGTRALRACIGAQLVLVSSWLNLATTADFAARRKPERVIVVCAGTGEGVALEDVIAAGEFCDALAARIEGIENADSVIIAHGMFLQALPDFGAAIGRTQNARRLLSRLELRGDVEFCLQRNVFEIAAGCDREGVVKRLT